MKKFTVGQVASIARFAVPALVLAAGSTMAHAQCTGFSVTTSSGSIVPGITDIGNHGDDVVTAVTLPFSVSMYGNSYSTVNVCSNGHIQFGGASNAYTNACLPDAAATLGVAMMPYWDDLRTDNPATVTPAPGIFTSVTGVAPNRVFNIEWRAVYFGATSSSLNFEVRLYEDNSRFEYVYGAVPQAGSSATVGVEASATAANQFSCNTSSLASGQMLTFTPINPTTVLCPTGSASPAGVTNCNGATTLLTVRVTPASSPTSTGIAVSANLSSIGGAASQAFYDDGTHGDAVAGDNTFSFSANVPSSVAVGTKTLAFTATDAQARTGGGTISLVVNCVTPPNPVLGPDVAVWAITDVPRWGTNAAGTITAYSVGTTSVNVGDYPVLWVDGAPSHLPDYNDSEQPCISQNMYRLKSYGAYSRFEHLGQSWLKHGFVSTNSGGGPTVPTPCVSNTQVWSYANQSYSNFGGDALGINCLDTYGGSLNGAQGNLGPKNVVNATTGYSPRIQGGGTGDATVMERLQVPTADVASQPAGTRFFVDGYYCTQDDSQFVRPGNTVATNALNNASWAEVTLASINTTPALTGVTQRYNPGIYAWKVADPTVTQVTADHDDAVNPGTGYRDIAGNPGFPGSTIRSRYVVSAKATSLGGGLYRYEYAVYNHNSDRSASRLSFPMPVAANVTDVTFHAPQWHSGEPYSNAPWTTTRSATDLTFKTQDYSANQNANALRWACLYNFGFTCNVAPTTGPATITLFKPNPVPGSPTAISAAGLPVPTVPVHCGPADMGQQGGVAGQDNILDNNDFIVFIDFFFNSDSRADVGIQGGVPGTDGIFDNNDFIVFIDQFFAGC